MSHLGKFCYNQIYGEIPKWLKGQAWKACRSLTGREGSNPSFSAIQEKLKFIFSFLITLFTSLTTGLGGLIPLST